MRKMVMIAVLAVMVAVATACGGGSAAVSTPAFTDEAAIDAMERAVALVAVGGKVAATPGTTSNYHTSARESCLRQP